MTTAQKTMVEAYFAGFRTTNHPAILACLTDDVVWDLPGFKHLEGKEAFDGEIEGEGFNGSPELEIDRLIEEGDAVVAVGTGAAPTQDGSTFHFAYNDIFTFRDGLIRRVESYIVPLDHPPTSS